MSEIIGLKSEAIRKLVHISAIVAIPASFFISYEIVVTVGAILCASYITAEYFRFRGEKVAFMTDLIKCCSRSKEREGWVITPLFLLFSVTALIGLSPIIGMNAAYVGISAATLGDSVAAIVGTKFGNHRNWILKGKSVEGCLAFFATTFLLSLLFVDWPAALVLSAITAIVEVVSLDYDNLTVPFAAALIASVF